MTLRIWLGEKMWCLGKKLSAFDGSSTAEQVTQGIDGTGLTAMVTGASSGIGAETARVLALRGVHVVMVDMNMEAGRRVKEKIVQETPAAKVDVIELDLSSMASVRKFATGYVASERPLNILINNAGVITPFRLSEDNLELQFATNYLGHFLLTHLLMDTMKKTARECGREGRIVNSSSVVHRLTYCGGIRFDRLNDPSGYSRWLAYGQSKLAIILHTNQLAKHLREEKLDITVNALHPGLTNTDLLHNTSFAEGMRRWVGKYFMKSVSQGAATTCYVALHPQVKAVSGEYFVNCNLAKPSSQARDAALAQQLWEFSMNLIK